MKRFIFIITLLFSANFIYAADGLISGKVIDSKSKEPIEYVTVTITKKGDDNSTPVGTTTDKEGNFSIKNIPYDNYVLSISFIGYNEFQQDISLSNSNNSVLLNQIQLSEDATMLDEVQVVGMKSQMRLDIDKKVFNVDQNIAAAGGTASEVLSNIPSVEVDNEGEVSLRGNSSVTIWINGKASGLSADNRAQILEQMPAENIEKIEVITNPSARYSPEGTAGIINIVLKQDRRGGYFGSIQAGVDTHGGYNASANINYSSSKLDAYASLGYRRREHKGGGYTDRLNISGIDTTFLNQTSSQDGHRENMFARLGLTYHVTPNDHITLGGFGMFGGGKSNNVNNYLSNVPNSYIESQRFTNSDNDMMGGNIEFGYKHDFSKTSNIDFMASYNKWGSDQTSIYTQNSLFADGRTTNSYQKQLNDMNSHNWEFQLDYVNAFNDNHKIEAGYKGTLGRENSPVETYAGTNESNAVPQTELFNRFIYNQDIHALYTTYSGRLSNFGYQLGLRGEYSNIETRSPGYNQSENDVTPHKKDYFSLFPSAFLSYVLPNNNEVQLNYTRRISRPRGRQLNSFVNITDSTNISYGNPYLSPEYSNAFELNYLKSWDKHMISFSGYYRTTDDVIQRINYLDNNVMKSTYENIAQTTSIGTELVAKNRLFSFLDLTTTVNLFHYKLDGFSYLPEGAATPVEGKEQKDFSWNARMIANCMLPKGFTLQLTGNYNAKQVIAQGERKANYSLDAGLRKSFNKFSVSVSARDLLDSRKWKTETSGTGFIQNSENWRGGRQVSATVTYSFGNMKPKRNADRNRNADNSGGGYDMDGDF